MESLIILLVLVFLTVPIILLIWVKISTSSSLSEVINKLIALIIKVHNLEDQKINGKEE